MPTIDEAVDGVLGAQQPAKKDDPIASAVDAVLAGERSQRRGVLHDALRVNPDQAAKAKQLERETGVPADVGLRNLLDVELRRNLDRIDTIASNEREASNTFRKYLTRSDFARMSHDDVDTLLGIDKQIKGPTIGPIYIKPTAGSVLSGLAQSPVQGFRAAREGMRMQMSDVLESVGVLKLDPVAKADQMRKLAQASGASEFTTPTFDTGLARGVYGGLSSTLRAAPGVALSVATRNPTPALASMGLQTQAESYAKYRTRGGAPGESFVGASAEGAIEVATELLPTKFLTEALGKKGFGEFISGMLVREIPGEQLATLGQDAVDTAIANPGKTWEQYFNERPAAAFETLVATVTQSAVMGGISSGLARLARDQQTLEDSDRNTQMFEALAAMAAQSKLRERDPQTFAQFVQDAAEGADNAPTHVYVDAKVMADVLNQMGISDEQLAQIMPSLPAQMAGAFEANATVEIPLGEALAAAPGTPLEKALMQNARMTPDGLSRVEVDAAAKQAEQFIGQEVDRLMQQATQTEQVQAEVQTIRENIAGQLKATGRFSNDVNEGYSRLVGAFYSTMSQRLGVTPSELYARFPLRVTGEQGAEGLAQFAGVNAQTSDRPALTDAEQMLKAGRSAETVRRETSWFIGVDGRWRFEISDDDAKFNSKGIVSPETVAEEIKGEVKVIPDPQVPGLFKAMYRQGTDDYLATFGRTEADAVAALSRAVAKARSQGAFDISKVKPGEALDMATVLDHPRLYAAYPDLAKMRVSFVTGEDYRGAFFPEADRINISITNDPEQMLSTLLHEIQHAIQQREGFATGGNSDSDFTKAVRNALTELENRTRLDVENWKWANKFKIDNYDEAAKVARFALMYESAQRLIGYANRDKPSGVFRNIRNEMQWIYDKDLNAVEAARELQRDFYAIPKPSKMRERNAFISDMAFRASQVLLGHIPAEYRDQFKNDTRTMRGMITGLQRAAEKARKELRPLNELEKARRDAQGVKDAHAYSSPFDIYRALAGEVEARNTQARQKMTEDERKATSPQMTADVPAEKVVVMFGGMDIQAPRVSAQTLAQSATPTQQTDTPEFKAWFGDSKVVDANGKPLVVYHGTAGDFSVFRDDIEGRAGFYFTDDKAFANSFAEGGGANVMPVYLSISKPADLRSGVPSQVADALDAAGYSRLDELLERDPRDIWNHFDGDRELSDMLQRAGYDGLRLAEPDFKRNVDSWVAFRPEQIKSAIGNDGTFDANDPSILSQSTLATYSPKELLIALGPESNYSSFIHELGHFWLDALADMASQPGAPQQIADDFATTAKWFGVDPAAWATMTLDQKRPYHERWAESVEQYIFEGKAPSLELQPLFRRFVSWMKTVYGELKRFIASRSATPGGQAAGGDTLAQSAFHGTPHRGIDKFSTDKIGTGEGAQAYGWGLYFASKREIAEWYRTTLAKTSIYYDGQPVAPTSDLYKTALDALTLGVDATKEKLRDIIKRNTERAKELNGKGPFAQVAKNTQARLDWLDSIDPAKLKDEGAPGQLYKVEIPEDSEMLLWDKPLSEQPEGVRKAAETRMEELRQMGARVPDAPSGEWIYKAFHRQGAEKADWNRSPAQQASEALAAAGIKGIKYLDGTSRGAGDGSFNYVIFSGDDVQITGQFYQRDQAQAGPLGLSDEIRRVMDRLIATDEQIAQAEEVAGMLPEFDATNTAIEKLQARSLANLKWLTRARDEKIRELQRQAKEARAAMRREAYREIMADPTMRAWAWLTRRVPDADKVRKVKEASSKGVDPAKDSLLTAIAKMGGLDRESAARLLGVHPDNFNHASGVFGKPVFRKSGGVDADTMGEMLAEVGYLMPGEEGRYDLRQLEEFIDDELNGTPHYSIAKEYGEARPGEGVDIEQLAAGRFDLGSLLEIGVPTQDAQRLEDRGMTSKSIGLHPDLIADAFGFDSGSALVEALLAAQSPAEAIEGLTDQRMLERYGDLIDARAIEEAANDAVHNEARARALAAELKAQNEAMNPRADTGRTASNGRPITVNALAEAMKQFANTLTERVLVGKIRSSIAQHRAAEARAGKAWQEFTAKGDTKEAVQAKRDQALNNYTVRAMLDAQAEAKKILEFFSRVTQGNDEKTVERGRDPDVVNAMRAILAMYGVAPRLNAGALDYLQRVRENDPAMFAAIEPGVSAAVSNAKPLAELNIGELRDLHEELRAMWDLAKRSRQMEVDGNLLDLEEAEAELVERMTEKGIPDRIAGEGQAVTVAEERKMSLSFIRAALSRVEQWAERMDGKFGGPFLRLVFQPIKQAADRYRAQRADYRKRFTALVEGLNGLLPDGPIDAPELGYKFGAARDSGMAELLHAILHTGNDSNKRKLLLGRGWAKDNGDGTLDTTQWDAFIQRMVAEGKLQPQHYEFAQGVWDLLDELKPGAQQAHRTVYGRYFAEVTANEFIDPFNVQRRGGYVPAMGDPRLTTEQDIRRAAEEESDSMSLAFPSSPRGFTKSRTEYNRPLMLDLRTLAQHIDKVILFTHMQPAVNDVRRLVTRKGVAYGLSRIDTAIYKGMLLPWLNRAAKQTVETPIAGDGKTARFASAMRARAGMALMFGNISNTLQQITGFTLAGVKVKPSLMLKATAAFTADPKGLVRNVLEQSPYMVDRLQNETSAMTDAVNDVLVNPNVYDKAQAWTQRHGYFLQTAFDKVMSPIIWTAAYNQGIEQKMEHDQAVQFADGVIRQTQGTTLPEDVSRFETGPAYLRLFTQFVGYFNMMANTNATAFKQIVDSTGLKKGAGRALYLAAMGVFLPIWIAEAIAQAFRGGPDDEDKDGEHLDDWLMAVFGLGTARGLLAQVPLLGMAAQGVINRFNDNPADDKFSLSPAVSLVESAAGAPASVYKAIADEGDARKAIRDVASAATLVTGLPFYAAARPLGYAAAVAQDKVEPTGPVDLARGLVTGTPSPESKQ